MIEQDACQPRLGDRTRSDGVLTQRLRSAEPRRILCKGRRASNGRCWRIEVNGAGTHPLYQLLKREQPGLLGTQTIKWNFTRFVIDRQGNAILLVTGDVPHRYDEKPAIRALTALSVSSPPAAEGLFVSSTGSF